MRHEITLVCFLTKISLEYYCLLLLKLLSVVEISKNYLLYGGHHGAIVVSITVGLRMCLLSGVVSKRDRRSKRSQIMWHFHTFK